MLKIKKIIFTVSLLMALFAIFEMSTIVTAMVPLEHCNCEEDAIAQCLAIGSTALAATKICETLAYSSCIARCFPQSKPESNCDCIAYGLHYCTESPHFVAQECRNYFIAQCQLRCVTSLKKDPKITDHGRKKDNNIRNQFSGKQILTKNVNEYFSFVSKSASNQTVINYYAFVDCKKGNDSSNFFANNTTGAPIWKTLQHALDCMTNSPNNNLSVSYTVYIMPGIYNASAFINNLNFSLIANSSTKKDPPSTLDVVIIPPYQNSFFISCLKGSLYLEGILISNFTSSSLGMYYMSNITIYRCEFINNVVKNRDMYGGALLVQSFESLRIDKSKFSGNGALFGGAISAAFGILIQLSHSSFEGNVVDTNNMNTGSGGAIFINECHYVEIYESSFKNNVGLIGGAIYMEYIFVNISLYNNSFTSNSAGDTGGGVAMMVFNSLYFSKNTFTMNSAITRSGAAFIQSGTYFLSSCSNYPEITIKESYFYNNSASQGGALMISCASPIIEDCILKGNKASNMGGAIELFLTRQPSTITRCQFEENAAGIGGALLVQYSGLSINKSNFTSNCALNYGGAIFNQGEVTIEYSNLISNTVGSYGGAIFNCITLYISHCHLNQNTAQVFGGAVFIETDSVNTIIINSNLSSNTAHFFGGGIFLNESNATLRSNNISLNRAKFGGAIGTTGKSFVSSEGDYFLLNSATSGGAFYSEQKATLIFTSVIFINCVAEINGGVFSTNKSVLSFNNCTLSDNCAGSNGGVIYCANNCTITLSNNSNIFNNSAQNFGGAICMTNGILNIKNSYFFENKAPNLQVGGVGGVIWSESTEISVISCEFTQNSATAFGGVVFFDHSSSNLVKFVSTNNTWKNNSIDGQGGSVWTFQGNVYAEISGDTFDFNTALYGQTIVFYHISVIKITNTTFSNNQALKGSSIYCDHCSSLSIIEMGEFENNVALEQGAALYLLNCSFSIRNSLFSNNNATQEGGAIYFSSQQKENFLSLENNTFLENRSLKKGGALFLNITLLNNSTINLFSINCSNFSRNKATHGGAIYFQFYFTSSNISNNSTLDIFNSNFISNQANANGGSAFFDFITKNEINLKDDFISLHSLFFNNSFSKEDGGAIYFKFPMWLTKRDYKIIKINLSQFENCSSLYNNGGAIFLINNNINNISNNISSFEIGNNDFFNCKTPNGGGIIFWNSDVINEQQKKEINTSLDNNNFRNTLVLYGNNISTPPFKVSNTFVPSTIFNAYKFILSYKLVDFYNETVNFNASSSSLPQLSLKSSCGALDTSFYQNRFHVSQNGTVNLTDVILRGISNNSFVSITVNLLNSEIANKNISLSLQINILGCPLGYQENNSTSNCYPCEYANYALGGKCIQCPLFNSNDAKTQCAILNTSTSEQYFVNKGHWLISASNSNTNFILLSCGDYSSCENFTCQYSKNSTIGKINAIECYSNTLNTSVPKNVRGFGFCKKGYKGMFCSECDQKYFRNELNECIGCQNVPTWQLIVFPIAISILLLLIVIFPSTLLLFGIIQIMVVIVSLIVGFGNQWYLEILIVTLIIILILSRQSSENEGTFGVIKTAIFYFQIISILPISIWPSSLRYILSRISNILSLNLNLSSISCSFGFNTNNDQIIFLFKMLLPFLIIMVIILLILLQKIAIPVVAFIRSKCVRKPRVENINYLNVNEEDAIQYRKTFERVFGKDKGEDAKKEKQLNEQSWKEICLKILLFVLYLSHFDLTVEIFAVFNCVSPPNFPYSSQITPPYYLGTMPWILCHPINHSPYFILFLLAILFSVIYVIGIPFLFALILFVNRKSIQNDYGYENKIKWFAFYYQNYKIKNFWYEIVWMIRRTTIAVFLNLFANNLNLQTLSLCSILLLFVIINQYILPFRTNKENQVELICSILLLFALFSARTTQSSGNNDAIIWILFGVNVLFVLSLLILLFFPSIKRFRKSGKFKEIANRLCCLKKKKSRKRVEIIFEEEEEEKNENYDDIFASDYENQKEKYLPLLSSDKLIANNQQQQVENDNENEQEDQEKQYLRSQISSLRKRLVKANEEKEKIEIEKMERENEKEKEIEKLKKEIEKMKQL